MAKTVGKVVSNPVTELLSDAAAEGLSGGTATPFLPLINAGETATGDVLQGDSVGKSLGQGAITGAETLGAQELGSAVGIGSGNSAFNGALGITGDTPSGTGLPDVGSYISNALGGSTGATSDALGTGGNAAGASAGYSPDTSNFINQAVGSPTTNSLTSLPDLNTSNLTNLSATTPTSSLGGADQSFINSAVQSSGVNNPANITPNTPSNSIMSTIGSALKGNGGLALGAAGIGSNLLSQFKTPKGENQLLTAGGNALNTEQNLISTLQSGQLPPGEQSVINQGLQDAQNAIKAKYASLGLTGSTMEQQALQAAAQDAQTQATNYASQATQAGLQAVGATGTIYSNIMNSILGNSNTLTKALASLGGAATGAGTNNQPVALP